MGRVTTRKPCLYRFLKRKKEKKNNKTKVHRMLRVHHFFIQAKQDNEVKKENQDISSFKNVKL